MLALPVQISTNLHALSCEMIFCFDFSSEEHLFLEHHLQFHLLHVIQRKKRRGAFCESCDFHVWAPWWTHHRTWTPSLALRMHEIMLVVSGSLVMKSWMVFRKKRPDGSSANSEKLEPDVESKLQTSTTCERKTSLWGKKLSNQVKSSHKVLPRRFCDFSIPETLLQVKTKITEDLKISKTFVLLQSSDFFLLKYRGTGIIWNSLFKIQHNLNTTLDVFYLQMQKVDGQLETLHNSKESISLENWRKSCGNDCILSWTFLLVLPHNIFWSEAIFKNI